VVKEDFASIMPNLHKGVAKTPLCNLEEANSEWSISAYPPSWRMPDDGGHAGSRIQALRNYARYRNTELILDDDTFFLAKNGTSMSVSTVKYLVAKYVKQAEIRNKVSVHTASIMTSAILDDRHSGQSLSISHPIIRNIHT
jgi:hypothetical protein